MKIFALDTSAAAASCALLDGERPVGEFYTDARLTHSQTIMPMVEALLSSGHQELDSRWFEIHYPSPISCRSSG